MIDVHREGSKQSAVLRIDPMDEHCANNLNITKDTMNQLTPKFLLTKGSKWVELSTSAFRLMEVG